ncbi:trypsin-like serine protease [Streptomyces sp. NBC_00829]|uniref:trypsin-like serine protease n=1 Tax=Streptomyces sp. NBC_00829 TaxID=2903679 RepID=UPI002F908901|nr:trypsin-like serine protease [Streptomyces sp. NBC_00829]
MSVTRPRAHAVAGALAAAVVAGAIGPVPVHAATGPATDGGYSFAAKLEIGDGEDKRACTGVLVDPQWVLAASSCFTGGTGEPAPGKPQWKTVATIGRADLTTTGGHVSEIVELVPRKGRDLVMARLAQPAKDITPVTTAASPVAAGDTLTTAGYGRTKTAWVPDKLHTAAFTVNAVDATSLHLAGKTTSDAICKGDTGAPLLRESNGKQELVAIASQSMQGGCLGETETRNDALSIRTDDVKAWIEQLRLVPLVSQVTDAITTADFNGDGRLDIAAVLNDGSLKAFYGRTDGTLQYGRDLWRDKGWAGIKKIIGGDFNGDGKADIAAISGSGALLLYPGTSHEGKLGDSRPMWKDNTWNSSRPLTRYKADDSGRDGIALQADDGALYGYPSNPEGVLTGERRSLWPDKTWTKRLIAAGDLNGDTYDDVIAVAADGKLHLYPGNAQHTLGGAVLLWHDASWSNIKTVLAGDINGDRKGDLLGRVSSGGLYWYAGNGATTIAPGQLMWPTTTTAS